MPDQNNMAHRRESRRLKREARAARRKATREQRRAIDSVVAETFSVAHGNEPRAKEMAEQRFAELGFDPMTILMLVQVAILIYKALKALNVFSPTPEVVAAIFEDDSDA